MESIQDFVDTVTRYSAEADGPQVTVPVKILEESLDHIKGLRERLTEAQESYKPSVAKRLNEKITQLEREIAELRNRNKVNELEKKVQRLESELKASYSTKNFTIKNGMLEIEKQYRSAIEASLESQQLWHDIMNLLGDEVRDLPVSYLARQEASVRKNASRRAEAASDAAAISSAPSDAVVALEPELSHPGAQTYVQQTAQSLAEQLRKITEHAHPDVPKAHEPAAAVKAADVRDGRQSVGEVVETSTSMAQAREFFKDASAPLLAVHAGSPSKRHASLIPDARATDLLNESVEESLDNLRQLFQGASVRSGPASATKGVSPQLVADAGYFEQQMDTLEADVQRLRRLYKSAGPAAAAAAGAAPVGPRLHGQGLVADASSLDKQMDDALASISELRGMYSQAASVPAGRPAAAAGPHARTEGVPDASALQHKLKILSSDLVGLQHAFANGGLASPGRHDHNQSAAASTTGQGAQGAGDVDELVGLFAQFMGEVVESGSFPVSKAAAPNGSSTAGSGPDLDQLSKMFRKWLEQQGGQLPAAGKLLLAAAAGAGTKAPGVAVDVPRAGEGAGTDASSSTDMAPAADKGVVTDISLASGADAAATLRASLPGTDASTGTDLTFALPQDAAALASGRASLPGTDASTGTEITLAPGDTSLLAGRPATHATDVAIGTEISITTDSVPPAPEAALQEVAAAASGAQAQSAELGAQAAGTAPEAVAEVAAAEAPLSPTLEALDAAEVLGAGKAGAEAGTAGSAMMGMGAVQRGVEVLEQRHTRLLQASPSGARLMRDVTTLLAAFVDAHNNSVSTLQHQQQQRQLVRTTSRRRQSTSALASTFEQEGTEGKALSTEASTAGSDAAAGVGGADDGWAEGDAAAAEGSSRSAPAQVAAASTDAADATAAEDGNTAGAGVEDSSRAAVSSAAAASGPAAAAAASSVREAEEATSSADAAQAGGSTAKKLEGTPSAQDDTVAASGQSADWDDDAVGSVASADLMAELEEARAKVEHYEVLVRKLNDQMRRAMEKMDDQGDTLAMRAQRSEEVERKNGELEGENMYLTSQLITTKVELATSKGEYMTLLKALKKALNRENDAMQQLEELERVIQVVAPSDNGGGSILQPGTSRLAVDTADSDYFGRSQLTQRSGFFANVLRSSSLQKDAAQTSSPTTRQPSTPFMRQPSTPTARQSKEDLAQ